MMCFVGWYASVSVGLVAVGWQGEVRCLRLRLEKTEGSKRTSLVALASTELCYPSTNNVIFFGGIFKVFFNYLFLKQVSFFYLFLWFFLSEVKVVGGPNFFHKEKVFFFCKIQNIPIHQIFNGVQITDKKWFSI